MFETGVVDGFGEIQSTTSMLATKSVSGIPSGDNRHSPGTGNHEGSGKDKSHYIIAAFAKDDGFGSKPANVHRFKGGPGSVRLSQLSASSLDVFR